MSQNTNASSNGMGATTSPNKSPLPTRLNDTTTPAFDAWLSKVDSTDDRHVLAFHCILGSVVAVCTLYHAFRTISTWRFHREPVKSYLAANVARAARAYARKYLLYYTVPTPYFFFTGMEMLLVCAYALTVIILAFSNLSSSPDFFGMTLDGFSSRCSYTFVASLPWIVALSAKNNFLSMLTGVPYQRMQIYHRSLARIGLLLVLVHAGAKLAKDRDVVSETFRRWGLAGLLVAFLLWFVSTRNIMNKGYQLFLHMHVVIILALGFCIWQHTSRVNDESTRVHLYLAIAGGLWAAERLLRITRIIKVNLFVCWGGKNARSPHSRKATGLLLSKDMMRLEIDKPGFGTWHPGQHVYLTSPPLLGLSYIFEAHPFTIASISPSRDAHRHNTDDPVKSPLVDDVELCRYSKEGPIPTSTLRESHLENPSGKLVFYIRARGGFTRRLSRRIQSGGPLRLLVYGPFSRPLSLASGYETVLLFAGGAGVSWTLPILLDLCRQARQGTNVVRQVVWVWCVPSSESMSWLASAISAALNVDLSVLVLDIRVYITQEHAHRMEPPREWTDVATGKQRAPWIVQGRPPIRGLVEGSIGNAAGRIWIGTSGPSSLSLTVRSHARQMIEPRDILRGDYTTDITIHTET